LRASVVIICATKEDNTQPYGKPVLFFQKAIPVAGSSWRRYDVQGCASSLAPTPWEEIWQAMEQSLYNLKDRMIELEVIPACRHYGLGLIPYCPLGAGLLGGVLGSGAEQGADPTRQRQIARYRPQLEAYEQFCHDLGEEPADVALAWLLHNPAVSVVLTGSDTLEQLTSLDRFASWNYSA
jgi:aryl-alcohol dehydrogenase-like predicted oxidoreductase